ncbi:MAG TPA: hypothetical protein VIM41_00460 [Gammaproteobacteria bacterium]
MVRWNYSLTAFWLSACVGFFTSLPTFAGSYARINTGNNNSIARCFDPHGNITYTDFLCYTYENDNPLLMTDNAVQRHIRTKQAAPGNTAQPKPNTYNTTGNTSAGALSYSDLSSVANQAVARCTENFARYFKRKYRAGTTVPVIEFSEITHQFAKGTNVSITALGAILVKDNAASREVNIECTAQKLRADLDWQIGFREP